MKGNNYGKPTNPASGVIVRSAPLTTATVAIISKNKTRSA